MNKFYVKLKSRTIMSILRRKEKVFTLVGKNGESLERGSFKKCQTFIEAESLTGEMLGPDQDFKITRVDGKDHYTIIPTGEKEVINKEGIALIAGFGILVSGCLISLFKKRKKKENK